jgi:hypothetical protein
VATDPQAAPAEVKPSWVMVNFTPSPVARLRWPVSGGPSPVVRLRFLGGSMAKEPFERSSARRGPRLPAPPSGSARSLAPLVQPVQQPPATRVRNERLEHLVHTVQPPPGGM